MENNEMMVNTVVETAADVMDSAVDNTSGFGFGDVMIGGLALLGAIHVVKGAVKLGAKGVNWLKNKQKLKKGKPEEAAEDLTEGTDVEKDYKIE